MKKSDLIEKIKETMQEDSELKSILLFNLEKKHHDELSDKEVLEYMDFIMDNYQATQSEKVVNLNKQVSGGIDGLSRLKKWSNLSAISDHALEEAMSILSVEAQKDNDDNLMNEMVEHFKAKLWFSKLDGPTRLKIYREF